MQVSLGKDGFEFFEVVDVPNIEWLAETLTKRDFSPAIFRNGKRALANFEYAYCIGLDIDNDGKKDTPLMTIAEATEAFKEYRHIILPSRSHQKEKHGKIADRFRVILFFSEPISDVETMYNTWFWCKSKWPSIDPQCKDPSRGYYMHGSVYSIQTTGLLVDPQLPVKKEREKSDVVPLPGEKGKLSAETKQLLENGVETGSRNGSVFKAARDFHQNLYSEAEAIEALITALTNNDTIAFDFPESEVLRTIRSAYATAPKHDPRIPVRAFKLQPIGELYKATSEEKIDWLVDGLLQAGGVSLLSADPKAGKSVIARQLCKHVIHAIPFFGRKVKQGGCHYYGIEEHRMMLAQSFRKLGILPNAPLLVHAEDPLKDEGMFEDFAAIICETRPALAVVDTAFDLIEVESENNYREVKKAFKKVRKVARESGTHIMLIHHNGKPQKDFRRRGNHAILGSTAISGGVDSILVIEIEGKTRMITTSGRQVDPWNKRELIWDKETETYSLGKEYEDF